MDMQDVEKSAQDPKWWLDSVTIHGALLGVFAMLPGTFHLLGVQIGPDQIQVFVNGVVGLCSFVGMVLVFVGSFNPKRGPLSLTKPPEDGAAQ
jgi:hypothetical protein